MRHDYQSKYKPAHANSQQDLREVIQLLEKASPQPDVPTAVPVITKMLTIATVPSGHVMDVATPKGTLPVTVPAECSVGTFFQFELETPIPVADFRAWPRQMAASTTTTVVTTHTAVDVNGDGYADSVATTTTQQVTVTAETKDVDGDGKADGVIGLAAS